MEIVRSSSSKASHVKTFSISNQPHFSEFGVPAEGEKVNKAESLDKM